jgi:hypothetical protein
MVVPLQIVGDTHIYIYIYIEREREREREKHRANRIDISETGSPAVVYFS